MTDRLTEQLLVSCSGCFHPEDGVPTDALKVARCKKDPWENACQVSCGHAHAHVAHAHAHVHVMCVKSAAAVAAVACLDTC